MPSQVRGGFIEASIQAAPFLMGFVFVIAVIGRHLFCFFSVFDVVEIAIHSLESFGYFLPFPLIAFSLC